MVLVRHLLKLTCKHFRPPHLLSLLNFYFSHCAICVTNSFSTAITSHLLWLLKMQTKAVEFCTPLFSYAFKRNVDTPLTANPWFEKFHKSTASLKSSWNGPKYIACADIRSLRVLTVACSKQILSWVSAAAIWYNLIPD